MRTLMFALCLLLALPVQASGPLLTDRDRQVMSVPGFLDAHPDMMYRQWGVNAMRRNDQEGAVKNFLLGAHYADKPSQGYLAEIYWYGGNQPPDRALAHAWMSVAAERGYPLLVQMREKFAAALTPEERERSAQLQQELLAQYGDAVAKPRMDDHLRRQLQEATGSRTGSMTHNLEIAYEENGTRKVMKGSQYYDKRYWEPEFYHRWQAEVWGKVPQVDVGMPTMVDSEGP